MTEKVYTDTLATITAHLRALGKEMATAPKATADGRSPTLARLQALFDLAAQDLGQQLLTVECIRHAPPAQRTIL